MPTRLTTIDQAQEYLLNFSDTKPSGEAYTLERMREFMKRLGNPQNSFKSIHVAGTSGKTSTAYFIREMLLQAGCHVGLTASPHVVSITERVQIGDGPLTDEVFLRYLNEFLKTIELWEDIQPTYFELLIAFAYFVFSKENVDYAVVEVGLGGLHDATNVITRADKVSVITPIGLDHTQILGHTIEEIAVQKAGIILPGSHAFMTHQSDTAMRVVDEIRKQRQASLEIVRQSVQGGLLPQFQESNFSLAKAAFEYVAVRDGISSLDEKQLMKVRHRTPPGRFESHDISGKTVMLDGAHNPQKLTAFTQAYDKLARPDTTWVVALLDGPKDKLESCVEIIMRQPGRIIVTEFNIEQGGKSRRSISVERFVKMAERYESDIVAEPDPLKALTLALERPGSSVVVTGSLYLVGIVRKRLGQLHGGRL